MLSYDLAPDVRVSQITRQVAVAVETISQRVAGPIYLAGHSAGGHLVSRMLCPDVPLSMRGRIARVMPISPVADLRPLLRTDLNEDLKLDETEAAAESPILSKQMGATPVHVWVGSDERPAFIDQARWLQDAWQTELTLDPGKHHFNVIDGLLTSDSALMTALLSP
jgi:alpha-beta hydrolase superfamily lysophospholipase